MDTSLVQLRITLQVSGGVSTPYPLFELKKLFPAAFRRATGCSGGKEGCQGGDSCPCRLTFGQELSDDPSLLRRHQKPPLPFIFEIPLLQDGELLKREIVAGLLLIGSAATSHIEIYLQALLYLFDSTPLLALKGVKLCKVEALSLDGCHTFLGDSSGKFDLTSIPVAGFDEFLSAPAGSIPSITLEITTPLRIMAAGRPLRDLPFPAVAGALFRRISSLASYYGGVELGHDFKWLAEQSREIKCSGSELSWVNWGGSVQGLVGKISYSGDLAGFLPFLKLGELLHLGKGSSYGMGKYDMTAE